ncbi:MAG TPA: 3-oxoacyl-[acyl-carrier-protein] reductase [Planctomycetaceae bacterium]|nr:3-oxoacyl-[acyl-carrier-protein] reductase [Planctomycetaceae bacterium]
MDFQGRTAIVTGAARGIGFEIARRLAQGGATVVLVDVAEEALAEAAKGLGADPDRVLSFVVDVTDEEAVERLVDAVVEKTGRLDILVNNAGITRDDLLLRMTQEQWDAVIAVNLKGTFLMTKHACRPMLRQRSGRIVNLASVSGLVGNPGQANYSASKAGVVGFTKTVARELAGKKICCNAVAPGFIDTEMTRVLPEKAKQRALGAIPLGRMGTAEEIAAAVCFLASDDASYITGQVLAVDGGMAT